MSKSCSGYCRSFQVFARNHCHKMVPAAKQGSITLVQAFGGPSNQVPVTRWRPDTHAHKMSGPMNHGTLADQSSHIHLMGSPSDLASTAGASFIFPALAKEGLSDPASTTNKDSHAMARATCSTGSVVLSTIGNIHLHTHAMEKHNGQVPTTAWGLPTQVYTMG